MQPLTNNSTEVTTMQSFRALIGWLSDQEATQFLLGRQQLPTDDLEQINEVIANCRAAVTSRPMFTSKNPLIDIEDDAIRKTILERPDIHAAFAGLQWYPAMVDLREVLAFQKLINTEGLEARLALVQTSKEELFELCIPTNQPLPPAGAIVDQDGKGFTISSLNPNLRITGSQASGMQTNPNLPTVGAIAITLLVSMGSPYLQVVHYNGRYFIRDGYHRACGLVHANMNIVPCIVINAQSFEQAVPQPQMFLPYDVLFGEHPPRLADFWDDEVSCDVERPATRKVIRIRGDEFFVHG